jgi:hypothetical protein
MIVLVWVPNSKERKSNLRNPYLRVLMRITYLLYYRGSTSVLGSASTLTGLGMASYYTSGSELALLPIVDLINFCKLKVDYFVSGI